MLLTFVDVTARAHVEQQLEHANAQLESAYESLQSAHAHLWDLSAADAVDRPFVDLDIDLPTAELMDTVRPTAGNDEAEGPLVVAARDGRGQPVTCTVRLVPLGDRHAQDTGGRAIVLMQVTAHQS